MTTTGDAVPNANVCFEACVADMASCRAAVEGGAARLELCASLEVGGLTPSVGFVLTVHELFPQVALCALIRPRAGDFVLSADDLRVCCADIASLAAAGVGRVAIGALTALGEVDEPALAQLLAVCEANNLDVTFHRAIDASRNVEAAFDTVLRYPLVSAILSSGGMRSADEGVCMLATMVQKAAGRLDIIAAGGVSGDNAANIVRVSRVRWLHGSASYPIKSRVPPNGVTFCAAEEGAHRETAASIVAAIINAAARS